MSQGRPDYGKLLAAVEKRIQGKGRDWAFTPSDFADLGDTRSVGMIFTRLVKQEKLRRVRRGLYEVPHQHPIAGTVGASASALTNAVARRDGLKLLPSGAKAANDLGLSTQVPARVAYGVAGRSRTLSVGGAAKVQLRRRSPKVMALAGRVSGWLAEALRNVGRGKVSPDDLNALRHRLSAADRKSLRKDIRLVPAWMRPLFLEVARDE